MTYDDFLASLRQTPRDWTVDEYGYLRRPHGDGLWQCPVSALAHKESCCFRSAADAIALDATAAVLIAGAADNDKDCDPQIRADLLAATDPQP